MSVFRPPRSLPCPRRRAVDRRLRPPAQAATAPRSTSRSSSSPCPTACARHRAHRPQGADRRGQRLVPRRQQGRARRPQRLRPSVRAPDVQRQRERAGRVLHPVQGRSVPPARTAPPIPTAPTTSRTCRPPPSTWRCGWNPTAWATCRERAIDQATLDEQRGVVQNEKRQGENQPYGQVWDAIGKAMYPKGHPYHHSTIGSMNDLNAASLEDVKTWFRTLVRPEQRGAGAGWRHRPGHRQGEGREVLRRHPGRPEHGLSRRWTSPRSPATAAPR